MTKTWAKRDLHVSTCNLHPTCKWSKLWKNVTTKLEKSSLGRPEGQFPGSLGWRSNSLGPKSQKNPTKGRKSSKISAKTLIETPSPNPNPPPKKKKRLGPNLLLIFFVGKWCPLPKRLLYANPAGSFELIWSKAWQKWQKCATSSADCLAFWCLSCWAKVRIFTAYS